MHFEWDEAKNEANIRKHGIDFRDVWEAFRGPLLTAIDDRADHGEDRWIGIGMARSRIVVVVYTFPAVPALPDSFFARARLLKPIRTTSVTVDVDADVLDWFTAHGEKWQDQLNAALRIYAEAHREAELRRRNDSAA